MFLPINAVALTGQVLFISDFVLCRLLKCMEGQQRKAESHKGKQALHLEATGLVDTVHPLQHVAVAHARPSFRELAVLSLNMQTN